MTAFVGPTWVVNDCLATVEQQRTRRDTALRAVVSFAPSEEALTALADGLADDAALASLRRDPYWPKWDSPWWKLALLHELGESGRVPTVALKAFVAAIDGHYLRYFPTTEAELPKERAIDPRRHIPCHCALGTAMQIVHGADIEADTVLTWLRPWFLRYQLPDGGLNCDEAVYPRPTPRSSVVSTLPPLEAVLRCTPRAFTAIEHKFLDDGARYLLDRHLCRSPRRDWQLIDATWLEPVFPRYYNYDVLRGLAFVTEWAEITRQKLAVTPLREAMTAVVDRLDPAGCVVVGRDEISVAKTNTPVDDLVWPWGAAAATFPLLSELSVVGRPSQVLTRQWYDVLDRLERLGRTGLLV